MSSIHDWPEVVTADIAYPAVNYFPNSRVKEQIEHQAAEEVFSNNKNLLEAWQEFTKATTLEARIAKSADYLSILIQTIRYMENGYFSKELQQLWKNVMRDLKKFAEEFPLINGILDQLENERRKIKELS